MLWKVWTPEAGYIVENEGVAPDVDVEQTPKDVIAGRDPQLERAIAWVKEELAKDPPKAVKRPARISSTGSRSVSPHRSRSSR